MDTVVLVRVTTDPSVPVPTEEDTDGLPGVLSGITVLLEDVTDDPGVGVSKKELVSEVGRAELSTETVSVKVPFTVVTVVSSMLDDATVPFTVNGEV